MTQAKIKLVKFNARRADRLAAKFADRWVNTMVREVSNSWAIRTPVDTGHLRASRLTKVRKRSTRVIGWVYTRVHYAPMVHDGRGPVVPVRAKALRFVYNGRVIFRQRVGPAKAQPYAAHATVAVARAHHLRVVRG
jgi:hypothetical protein